MPRISSTFPLTCLPAKFSDTKCLEQGVHPRHKNRFGTRRACDCSAPPAARVIRHGFLFLLHAPVMEAPLAPAGAPHCQLSADGTLRAPTAAAQATARLCVRSGAYRCVCADTCTMSTPTTATESWDAAQHGFFCNISAMIVDVLRSCADFSSRPRSLLADTVLELHCSPYEYMYMDYRMEFLLLSSSWLKCSRIFVCKP